MKKTARRLTALVCALILLAGLGASALARGESYAAPLYVDGLRAGSVSMEDGVPYMGAAEFCQALGQTVTLGWDDKTDCALITGEGFSIEITDRHDYIAFNDCYLWAEEGVKVIGGSYAAPIDELCAAFGVSYEWNERSRAMSLRTDSMALMSFESFGWSEDDLYWMERVINSESGNQPLNGMIGVGNVVLNRVASDSFPDTVYGVIFEKGQFDPVALGTINDEPNTLAKVAAKLALEGYSTVGESTHFCAVGIDAVFATWDRFLVNIGGHNFYT